MRSGKRVSGMLVAGAILGLALAACGGDGEGEGSREASVIVPAAPAATAAAAATAAPAAAATAAPAVTQAPASPVLRQPGPSATTFRDYERTPFVDSSTDAVSTFSLDTDRTSYFLVT